MNANITQIRRLNGQDAGRHRCDSGADWQAVAQPQRIGLAVASDSGTKDRRQMWDCTHNGGRSCRSTHYVGLIYKKVERKPSNRLLKHVTASLRAGVVAIPATDRYAVALPIRTGSAAASDSGTHD